MSNSVIQEVIGENSFPDWAIESGFDVNSILNHSYIIAQLDFNDGDLPPHHKATVLHENYDAKSSNVDDCVIRMEFRIGEKTGNGWEIGENYDVESLKNSTYFIPVLPVDKFGNDRTYVNFYFKLPPNLEEFVEKYRDARDDT